MRDLRVTTVGDRATVIWRAPATGTVARYQIQAHRDDYYNEVAPDFGTRIVGGEKTSIRWPDLPLNHQVYFTVTPIGPDGPRGVSGSAGPYNSTGTVTPSSSYCRPDGTQYCVVVDTGEPLGKERRPGAGLLLGTVARSNRWVRQLKLHFWRITAADATQYANAAAQVRPRDIIEILSSAWYAETSRPSRGLYAADPWDDWGRYADFIRREVRGALKDGQRPVWEIQNEPENYAYDPAVRPTRALVERQYLVAYRAIKKVEPRARVIGPSIDWQYENPSVPWYIDMKTFIGYAAAHHMRLYAVAWHENGDLRNQSPLVYSEIPQALRDEAEEVRELIAENRGIGSPKLFVDENSSTAGQFIPGFEAGYLAAEDQAGVDEANRACWPYPRIPSRAACVEPSLGQLLNLDGNPNPSYWVMRDYAEMTGTRLRSETSDVALSALAAQARSGATHVLLGRHQTCSQPTTGAVYCGGPSALPGAKPTKLEVLLPMGARSATVRIQRIPNSLADTPRAPSSTRSVVNVRGGVASISIPSLGDGEACFVTVTPDVAGGRVPRSGDSVRHELPPAHGGARPTRLLREAGGNQVAANLHPFASRLTAMLTDQYGNSLADVKVTFKLESAAKGRFADNQTTATATTNADGIATSPTVVAGLSVGEWVATAYVTSVGVGNRAPVTYYSMRNRVL